MKLAHAAITAQASGNGNPRPPRSVGVQSLPPVGSPGGHAWRRNRLWAVPQVSSRRQRLACHVRRRPVRRIPERGRTIGLASAAGPPRRPPASGVVPTAKTGKSRLAKPHSKSPNHERHQHQDQGKLGLEPEVRPRCKGRVRTRSSVAATVQIATVRPGHPLRSHGNRPGLRRSGCAGRAADPSPHRQSVLLRRQLWELPGASIPNRRSRTPRRSASHRRRSSPGRRAFGLGPAATSAQSTGSADEKAREAQSPCPDAARSRSARPVAVPHITPLSRSPGA